MRPTIRRRFLGPIRHPLRKSNPPADAYELREALWDLITATQMSAGRDDDGVRLACAAAIQLLERGRTLPGTND